MEKMEISVTVGFNQATCDLLGKLMSTEVTAPIQTMKAKVIEEAVTEGTKQVEKDKVGLVTDMETEEEITTDEVTPDIDVAAVRNQIVEKTKELCRAKKQKAIKDLNAKYGVPKHSSLSDDQVSAYYQELEAIGG